MVKGALRPSVKVLRADGLVSFPGVGYLCFVLLNQNILITLLLSEKLLS